MLTVAEETLQQIVQAHGKQVATHLFGQEINGETYAICNADLLLKGDGDAADNIVGGPEHSTLATEFIEQSFADYYRTTILSKKTDPDKLHTLKSKMDGYQVYSPEQVNELVELYLNGADREKLDPILDACVAVYVDDLDEDGQVDFKGKAKAFVRTYDFLATILPYGVQDWEKLSIFLNFLIPKVPVPKEEDFATGILESIDMDSYRAEKKSTLAIALPDAEAEIEPWSMSGGGRKPEPELD